MAGHAPEFLPTHRRIRSWLIHASDLRLSLTMLGMATVLVSLLWLLQWGISV